MGQWSSLCLLLSFSSGSGKDGLVLQMKPEDFASIFYFPFAREAPKADISIYSNLAKGSQNMDAVAKETTSFLPMCCAYVYHFISSLSKVIS